MTQLEFVKNLNLYELKTQIKLQFPLTYCFTDHFYNKMQIRSISNDKANILCKKNISSFDMINSILGTASEYEIDCLTISEIIRPRTWQMVTNLRRNFVKYLKDDFNNFFINLRKSHNGSDHIDVNEIIKIIIKILEIVIPIEFYGCSKNKKEFYNSVRFILNGMHGQHVTIEKLLFKWNVDEISWLNDISEVNYKILILSKFVAFLIKFIVCSVIAVTFYVTTSQASNETRRLYYYFKSDWQKISNAIILDLLYKKHIIKCDFLSVGKKNKKIMTMDRRKDAKTFLRSLPVIRLVFKTYSSTRILIKYKKRTYLQKKNEIFRKNFFKAINPRNSCMNFQKRYSLLYNKWSMMDKPKLYFVKADLQDAFGSVDTNELKCILTKLYTDYQNTETNIVKKNVAATEYKKLVQELSSSVLVRWGSCVYEWKRGLIQGMKYSPILCEIFYNAIDAKYLSDFICESENEIKFFIRLVDDYLFVTNNIDTAQNFIQHLSKSIGINPKKTKTNFIEENGDISDKITFFGYEINTKNLEITRDNTVYCGQIKYRIAFNKAISESYTFLEKRITQTTVPISALHLSMPVNSEITIWNNIFITFCISANKFCTIIPMIFCDNVNFSAKAVFNIYKKKVAVRMCDFIVRTIKKNIQDCNEFLYCINHFRYIAYKALSLFSNNSTICMKLTPIVNIALKKSNCMHGPWKPHSSEINIDGIPKHSALRDICRRQDVKQIISSFVKIPSGFEAFR